jgi:hypothetical protein
MISIGPLGQTILTRLLSSLNRELWDAVRLVMLSFTSGFGVEDVSTVSAMSPWSA